MSELSYPLPPAAPSSPAPSTRSAPRAGPVPVGRGGRPLRIAFVNDTMYPYMKGGKERRLYEVARRLVTRGHEVDVYTMKWWEGPRDIDLEGIHLHAITRLWPLYSGGRRSVVEGVMFGLATLRTMRADFDVVDVDQMPFFQLFAGRLVCSLRRRRMVTTWHEFWGPSYWQDYLGRLGVIGATIERWACQLPDALICMTEDSRGRLHGVGVTAPIVPAPPGIDFATIDATEPTEPASDVMYAGRLLDNKRVELLVRATAILRAERPAIRTLIVGGGPEAASLEKLIDELDLRANVRLVDHVPDIHAVMKSSRVFCLPSVREGFGLSALEANACGLPVVTTTHPDNATRFFIEDGGNGRLADPDPPSIARALARCLDAADDMDPRRVIVESGVGADWDVVTDRILRVLAGDVDEPRHRPVLQVVPYYPPHLGGMENVAAQLGQAQSATRPVTVITSDRGAEGSARRHRTGRLVVRRHRAAEVAHTPLAPGALWALVRSPRRAVVHVHVAQAAFPEMVWLAARLRRRPYVAHFHLDVDPSGWAGRLLGLYKRIFLGRVLRDAGAVIALSEEQAAFLRARYRVDPSRVAVIPNGVGEEFFVDPGLRAGRGGPLRVLFVGRLAPQKNLGLLLQAVEAASVPVELVVVGDGAEKGALQRRAAALVPTAASTVRIVGPAFGDELLEWYRWADVLAMTSDKEGMSLSMLEAMAAGLPVLATDTPGSRATIGGAGVVVGPDPAALAAALADLAADPARRAAMGACGRELARALSWPTLAARVDEVYRRLDHRGGPVSKAG